MTVGLYRSITSYTATGLTNDTEYAFEVRPFTTAGQTALDEITLTPTAADGWQGITGSDETTASYDATCGSAAGDPLCVFQVRPLVHPTSNEATVTPPDNTGWTDISATVAEPVVVEQSTTTTASQGAAIQSTLTLTPSSASVTLTWTAPSDTTNISKYRSRHKKTSESWPTADAVRLDGHLRHFQRQDLSQHDVPHHR